MKLFYKKLKIKEKNSTNRVLKTIKHVQTLIIQH